MQNAQMNFSDITAALQHQPYNLPTTTFLPLAYEVGRPHGAVVLVQAAVGARAPCFETLEPPPPPKKKRGKGPPLFLSILPLLGVGSPRVAGPVPSPRDSAPGLYMHHGAERDMSSAHGGVGVSVAKSALTAAATAGATATARLQQGPGTNHDDIIPGSASASAHQPDLSPPVSAPESMCGPPSLGGAAVMRAPLNLNTGETNSVRHQSDPECRNALRDTPTRLPRLPRYHDPQRPAVVRGSPWRRCGQRGSAAPPGREIARRDFLCQCMRDLGGGGVGWGTSPPARPPTQAVRWDPALDPPQSSVAELRCAPRDIILFLSGGRFPS